MARLAELYGANIELNGQVGFFSGLALFDLIGCEFLHACYSEVCGLL